MIVTEQERLVYEVTSRRDVPPHRVDLGSLLHRGLCNGKCTCEDFAMTIFPLIRELRRRDLAKWVGEIKILYRKEVVTFGEPEKPWRFYPADEFRCPHIRAADWHQYQMHKGVVAAAIRKEFDDYKLDNEWD